MLSEEARGSEENTTWWESSVIRRGGSAETLAHHAGLGGNSWVWAATVWLESGPV